MKISKDRLRASALFLFSSLAALTVGTGAGAAPAAAPLASATDFAVLAGAGITNAAGQTTITGDIGSYTTATITGTASLSLTGTNHGGDAVTQQAKADLGSAYDDAVAAGQGTATPITADLGGKVLAPGVYNAGSSIGLGGVLTLDARGDRDAVFIFQAGSTLTTASGSRIELVNDAQSCNVYWQVGSSATLGTDSRFVGSILAMSDITVPRGVSLDGRALARDGAVSLDTATITAPACISTAVTARGFAAKRGAAGISLRWRTAAEVGLLGFNVYGQRGSTRIRLNSKLIAGRAMGTTSGQGYVYTATPAKRVSRYWLQLVQLDGTRTWAGSADLSAPR